MMSPSITAGSAALRAGPPAGHIRFGASV